MPRRLTVIALALSLHVALSSLRGQALNQPSFTWSQGISLAGAGAVAVGALLLQGDPPAGVCAPCDAAEVPDVDRWTIGPMQPALGTASDVLVWGMAAVTSVDTWRAERSTRAVLVTLEGWAWAEGITQLAKSATDRKRPIMYTDGAPAAADDGDSYRSMPSGHTASAFAFAVGYWLNAPRRGLAPKLAAMGVAVAIGVLRVASGDHFPTDVLAGAAVGTGTAIVVHRIRY